MAVLLVGVAVALISWYVVFRMRRRRLYELAAKLPGPPQLPLIGHAHRFVGDTGDIMTTLKELSLLATHQGGFTKIWVGPMLFCMLTDPVDIEYVLKNCLDKDHHFTYFFEKIVGNGIFFAPVSIWRRRRKVMAPAFSIKNLSLIVKVFQAQSQMMVQRIRSKAGAGPFNAFPHFSLYTVKAIFEAGLGIDSTVWNKQFDQVLEVLARLLRLVSLRLFYPWMQPDWLFRLTPYYKTYNDGLNFAYSFIDEVLKHALGENKTDTSEKHEQNIETVDQQEATFTPIINFATSLTERRYTNLELREEVLSLGIAGTDTSAVGSSFTLLLLAKHQDVQEKAYQEILEIFGESDRPLVKEDLSKLCYLERVIKESLRLYPPVPIIARESNKDITLPSGKVVPAGCPMQISIWGVHRNSAYWGADADLFLPDRFSPDRTDLVPGAYFAFSAGPRNCIGYQYAMMSMKTSLSTLLRRYRVRASPQDTGPQMIPVSFEIMLKPSNGFNVILETREHITDSSLSSI